MLFKNESGSYIAYWLASSFVYAEQYWADLGMRRVENNGVVKRIAIWGTATEGERYYETGVRPVIVMSSSF